MYRNYTAVVVTVLVGEVNSSGGDGVEGWKSSYSFNLRYLGKEAMLSFDAIFPHLQSTWMIRVFCGRKEKSGRIFGTN